ncbi:MAG: hypothetical protein SFX73_38265 [Kofleriaceae bacterium]|nr:hypothetical protein [Kofleriaceae bacterium]
MSRPRGEHPTPDEGSDSALALARVFQAEQASREWFVVTAITRCELGVDCWLGLLREHVDRLHVLPLVLPPHAFAGMLGRLIAVAPGHELEAQLDLAAERMNIGVIVSATAAWCEQLRTSTHFVSQDVGLVQLDGTDVPARLLLFTADTPVELVHRATEAGLEASDLLLVCAPRPTG